MRFDHLSHFTQSRHLDRWQHFKCEQRLFPAVERAQGQFRDNKWVHSDVEQVELNTQCAIVRPQMVDPYGRIRQDQSSSTRRRGISASSGMVPPRAASRREASRSIRAFNPSRTSAVLSCTPVSSCAMRTRSSSSAKVVLMSPIIASCDVVLMRLNWKESKQHKPHLIFRMRLADPSPRQRRK